MVPETKDILCDNVYTLANNLVTLNVFINIEIIALVFIYTNIIIDTKVMQYMQGCVRSSHDFLVIKKSFLMNFHLLKPFLKETILYSRHRKRSQFSRRFPDQLPIP